MKTPGIIKKIHNMCIKFMVSRIFKVYLDPSVPLSNKISHEQWLNHLVELGNHAGMSILEIGSREVTGPSQARRVFSKAKYVGFDYYPGANVDVVGDAHKLSDYFDEKFDIIFSSAVMEHLAMPWVVALEITKLLKTGGYVFIETHFACGSHERPWHFFHFSDMGLKSLFSPALGFECLEAGMSNPIIGIFSSLADEYLQFTEIPHLYCHSQYLGRKTKNVDVGNFNWNDVAIEEIVNDTKYPMPRT